jgi:hypothetical protein
MSGSLYGVYFAAVPGNQVTVLVDTLTTHEVHHKYVTLLLR